MDPDGGSFDRLVRRLTEADDEAAVRRILEDSIPTLRGEDDQRAATETDGGAIADSEYDLRDVLAVLTHDIQNPQAVARGSLRQYKQTGESRYLEQLERAQRRVEAITEDALELARHGDTVEDTEWVWLSSSARAVWRTLETHDATLECEDTVTVHANEKRLRRLLQNLFENAVVHGGPESTVTVGPTDGGDGFYVDDDGPGIHPEERDRVFEFGYSTSEDGTGFGLCIARTIATGHDWTLSITESPDGGARIVVSGVDVRAE